APDIYLKAAAMLGAAPEQCVVVEDALNGIQAAKSAGMVCIAVATTFAREKLKSVQPDYIVANLNQVWEIVLQGRD
ncbi:HAD family phosphatase, partial [candidate division KSB1 bacterium]